MHAPVPPPAVLFCYPRCRKAVLECGILIPAESETKLLGRRIRADAEKRGEWDGQFAISEIHPLSFSTPTERLYNRFGYRGSVFSLLCLFVRRKDMSIACGSNSHSHS